jgi:hypothetical protein
MTTVAIPKPPRQTANPSPVRRAGSIRRTTSLDVEWLDGPTGTRRFHGVAQDIRGDAVLAEAKLTADLDPARTILALSADPAPAALQSLVGERGGGHLRMAMGERLPKLISAGAPLYLLLDDLSGVSLISGWGWSLWNPNWMSEQFGAAGDAERQRMMQERAGVCWGLQLGNSGMNPDRSGIDGEPADGGELRNPADPAGWHAFPDLAGVSMRRARRIDVWREDGLICFDSSFQDSAPKPQGGRAALHEYRLTGTMDPVTSELLSLEPEPRVLPFHECPGAVANANKLVGTPLPLIRQAVLTDLRGTSGCTHLNDALRALAEVPLLAEKI